MACCRSLQQAIVYACHGTPAAGPSTSYGSKPALVFSTRSRWQRLGRCTVLASLTSSYASQLARISPTAAGLSVATTHPLPQTFSYEQTLLGHILDDYLKTEKEFPRACPVCDDNQFMKPAADAASAADGVVDFASRPWCCDQCARWFHLGCLGVEYMEDVPMKPYLHCKQCRDMFVRIESAAQMGERPAPSHLQALGYSWSLVTEADHNQLLADGDAGTLPGGRKQAQRRRRGSALLGWHPDAAGSSSGSGAVTSGSSSGSSDGLADPEDYASRLLSIYIVLGDAFSSATLDTLAEASTEYEGGKYAMLLRHRGMPVSAAAFNVYGPELAQVNLLATAMDARRKGHGRALIGTLEHFLSTLGVQNVVLQPRRDTLDLWVKKFGYEALHPQDVWLLYQQAPLPHYDCAVLHKTLGNAPKL